MTPERAREILGVMPGVGRDVIKRAAAEAFRKAHPDTQRDGPAFVPLYSVGEVVTARARLLSLVSDVEIPCKLCKGRGVINGLRCVQCDGSGNQV